MHDLSPLWANMQHHYAVKPRFRPSSCPVVFHCNSELRSATFVLLCMKIHATKLLTHYSSIDINLLSLIMQFVVLDEAIACQNATEAKHCPKILEKNVGEGRPTRHVKPSCDELFKHDRLVISRLRDNLFLGARASPLAK
jgi:hypothetical protein